MVAFNAYHNAMFCCLWKPFHESSDFNPHGVMVKVPDCSVEVNEFELQLHYYVHFWTNALRGGGDMKTLLSAK